MSGFRPPLTITWQLVRGVFVWWRFDTWTSALIGWFGAGYYSHIDVVTPDGLLRGARSDELCGILAGYRDRPSNYEKWAKATRYTIAVTPAQYAAYWEFSNAQLGKPYDKRGLIATFVLGRRWRDQDSWWCSEEVAANIEHAGIAEIPPEFTGVEPGDCAFLFAGLRAVRTEIV